MPFERVTADRSGVAGTEGIRHAEPPARGPSCRRRRSRARRSPPSSGARPSAAASAGALLNTSIAGHDAAALAGRAARGQGRQRPKESFCVSSEGPCRWWRSSSRTGIGSALRPRHRTHSNPSHADNVNRGPATLHARPLRET
jgi:hypothetical protein